MMSAFEAIFFHEIDLKIRNTTKESMELLTECLLLLDKIEPVDEVDHGHSFWMCVERGSFDEWKEYASTQEELKNYSERKLKEIYNERFEEKTCWIDVYTCYNDRYNFKFLGFGDFHIDINASGEPLTIEDRYETDVSDFLRWFKEQVLKIIEGLKADTYNKFVAENLPYTDRFGTVRRDIYWKYFPDDKEWMLKDLTSEEIARFISIAEKQNDNYKPEGRLQNVTFMQYFSWAAAAYKAANFEMFTDDIVKLFFRYGEDFGGGVLNDLDYNSVKDFEDYYYERSGAMGGHPWGILMGSSRTRIMLYPYHDDGGYYFCFCGDPAHMIYEIVKMYLALYDLGLPLKLNMPREMIALLREEDLIGIEPDIWRHIYSPDAYRDKILGNRRIYDIEDNPEFFKEIEWIPVKELKLKDIGDINNGN